MDNGGFTERLNDNYAKNNNSNNDINKFIINF